MDRIKRQTAVTISNEWSSGGVVVDPGTVTIGVTRDDGTVVVAPGTATAGAGAAARTFNLTTAYTSLLDRLTATWTTSLQGVDETTHEIVGDFLFTIAQARALSALSNATTYPAAAIAEARTYVESELEHACGVAFVPRYGKVTLSGNGRYTLLLPPRATAVRSVTLDGVAVSTTDMRVMASGELYNPAGWTAGYANYVVAYEHGYSDGPERMAANRAALTWAKHELVKGPIDDRTTAFSTEDGTFSMSTPGIRGAITGIPAVDAFIGQYSLHVAVA